MTTHQAPKVLVDSTGLQRRMSFISGVGKPAIPQEPLVEYTAEVKAQMDYLVAKCPMEVGWFGLVDYDPKYHCYTIYRIVVPAQEVSHTETDISAQHMATAALALMDEGIDTGHMYAWFHSHVNMEVRPSGQDERQVAEFVECCPVFIRGIVNKRGDSKVDVYYRDHGIAYCNVPEIVDDPRKTEWCAGMDDIIKANVKRAVYKHANYRGYSPGKSAAHTTLPAPNVIQFDDYDEEANDYLIGWDSEDEDSLDHWATADINGNRKGVDDPEEDWYDF